MDLLEIVKGVFDRTSVRCGYPSPWLQPGALRRFLVEGEPFSDRDLIGYLWMLLSATIETTDTALANLLLAGITFDVLEQCRADRSLIPTAIEESLRLYPPMPAIALWARHDLEIGGARVAAGHQVTASLPAANRDPAYFQDPERFDIRRQPNRHLSYGWGRHYCLGVPLARQMMKIALEARADRIALPLEIDPTQAPRYRFGMITRPLAVPLLLAGGGALSTESTQRATRREGCSQ